MTINTSDTLKDITIAIPGATRVFEKLNIDYCCKGNRSLVEACSSANVQVETVVQSLELAREANASNAQGRNWSKESLNELTRFIVDTHHLFTREELERLEKLADKVCSVHGQRHPHLLQLRTLVQSLSGDLIPHMLKEEQVLFPYIGAVEAAVRENRPIPPAFFLTVRNPVRMMMLDHENAGQILEEIRSVTRNFTLPVDACATFEALYESLQDLEADLHQHIHLENNILFPRAIEIEGGPEANLDALPENGHGHSCFSR